MFVQDELRNYLNDIDKILLNVCDLVQLEII